MTSLALLPHIQAQCVHSIAWRSHINRSFATVLALQASVLGWHTVALLLAERVAPVLQISTRAAAMVSRARHRAPRPSRARTRDASALRSRSWSSALASAESCAASCGGISRTSPDAPLDCGGGGVEPSSEPVWWGNCVMSDAGTTRSQRERTFAAWRTASSAERAADACVLSPPPALRVGGSRDRKRLALGLRERLRDAARRARRLTEWIGHCGVRRCCDWHAPRHRLKVLKRCPVSSVGSSGLASPLRFAATFFLGSGSGGASAMPFQCHAPAAPSAPRMRTSSSPDRSPCLPRTGAACARPARVAPLVKL